MIDGKNASCHYQLHIQPCAQILGIKDLLDGMYMLKEDRAITHPELQQMLDI